MCGIAGMYAPGRENDDGSARVGDAIAALRHRGPDAQGVWTDADVTLGHARLSIIDLSAEANQPMHWPGLPVTLVYNGEAYNYRELRVQLESLGFAFRTRSDTEVVLAAYLAWGPAAFARINGMFACALWDARERCLHLVRDRFGVKPLYYCQNGKILYFASEPKAILAMHPDGARSLDRQALHEFLWFGNALGERTLFDGIRRVPPGTCVTVSDRGRRSMRLWSCAEVPAVTDDYDSAATEVRSRLRAAVRSHLVADVPVGVFLSGGIDSSAITAFAAEALGSDLRTFSVAFDYEQNSELAFARAIARKFQTRHEEITIRAPEARDLVPALVRCHDEPFSDAANIPLYLLSRQLRGTIKVVLQGDGGDELFAGYARYEWLRTARLPWPAARWLTRRIFPAHEPAPRRLARAVRVVEALGAEPVQRSVLLLTVETERLPPSGILGPELRASVQALDPFAAYREMQAATRGLDAVQSMLRTDLGILLPDTFLEKVDKATMANSIEVRVPFLDNDLATYAIGLPSRYKVRVGEKKRVLRRALRGIVPDAVLDRPKTGFGVPYQRWLRGPLREFLLEVTLNGAARRDRVLDATAIESLAAQHACGARDHGFLLWKALNFAVWYEAYRVSA